MDKQKLFIGFLESIREQNPALIEAVKEGYSAILEAGDKVMNHGEYQKSLRTKSDAALRFIMRDAREAMDAMPDNPNNGYYADEISYCASELFRRKQELIKKGKAKDSGWGEIEFYPPSRIPPKPMGKYSDLTGLARTPEEGMTLDI